MGTPESSFELTQFEKPVGLQTLPRFKAIDQMTHRTTVLHHSLRVSNSVFLYGLFLRELGIPFDLPKAMFMADCHDYPEAITDDIPTSVKRAATPEQKVQMKLADRAAANIIGDLIPQPASVPSYYPDLYNELEEKGSIEARVVNYSDKNDGLHEAVHEVACGDFADKFIPVIEAYEPDFIELNAANADWHNPISEAIGIGNLFEFPSVSKLNSVQVSDLNFSDSDRFIWSIAQRNPLSYYFWLKSAKNTFRYDFLEHVFPGWQSSLPEEIVKSVEAFNRRSATFQHSNGLLLPVENFAYSLAQDQFDLSLIKFARSARK